MRDFSLITSDGWQFEFDSKYWVVDFGIPDGFSLPPIEHITQKQFKQAGELLQDIHIGARLVTITGGINGDCLEELHSLRKRLFSALRWNRTNDDPPLPSQLRYRLNNKAAYLNCYYAGDVIANVGTDEKQQTIGIKLIAYDPLWYGEGQEKTLSVLNSFTVSYIVGKINGAWSAMGNVGTAAVFAVCYSIDKSKIYVAGIFTNWGGIAAADYIAAYDVTAGTWSALGASTLPSSAYCITVAPNGDVYVGGGNLFTGYVLKWDGAAWTTIASTANTTPGNVNALAFSPDGTLYAAGSFTQIGGVAANRIAKYSGGVWSALGTGADGLISDLVFAPDGTLYVAGAFSNIGGSAIEGVAKWNGSAWSALGSGAMTPAGAGECVAIGTDGSIYLGGQFTAVGGVTASRIAKWNGTAWLPLGSGVNNTVKRVRVAADGMLYVGGFFTSAGGLALADRIAVWNGSAWSQLDIDLPGTPYVYGIALDDDDVILGFDTTGTANFPAQQTNVVTEGDAQAYPVFTFTGPGTLQWIENVDSGKRIIFNVTLVAGEVVTIDLTPRVKTLTSSSRGDLLPYAALLPLSDFGSFALEPDPIAPLGVNTLNVLMTGTTPIEQNDNNNQLSAWANITGVTYLNTDSSGRMYASIIADGGGFYHVNLYKDAARTELVGHTASYNGAGAKAIVADNASGLGGTVTVDAVTAADADIIVYFATGKIEWTDAYLSVDANVGV